MTFGTRVTSITQDRILPKITDQLLGDNFMLYRYVSNGKKWDGETLKFPVMIAKNTQGGSFSGLDYHPTGTADTRVSLSYDPRGYEQTVAVVGMEEAVNETESGIIKLVRAEMETAKVSMLDSIGSLFYGDGTGNGGKDFNGLDLLADDTTTSTTIGGLSKTTYSSLQGTRTASGGTLTLAKLATLNTAVAGGSAMSQKPTIIVSDESVFNLYDSLLSPTIRANYEMNGLPVVTRTSKRPLPAAELRGTGGFTSLVYRGIPWVADEKSTSQTVWMLNENYLQWYGLKYSKLQQIDVSDDVIDGTYSDAPTGFTGLQWRPWQTPIDQLGSIANIYMMGNFVTNQPRRQGRLTGVTSV